MALTLNKVTDIIKQNNTFSFSFEVTPDITEEEINNLDVKPEFFSVTWHAKSHQCKNLDIEPIRKALYLRKKQENVLLHLSCDMLRKSFLDGLLTLLQANGICNLFVMLGESYDPATSDFNNTSELIKYIKGKYSDYFCIGVAGFLESSEEKLLKLKEKIEYGADFIMTQAFFETILFGNFLEKCKQAGINIPVIPGIFAFETYVQLNKFIELCKIKVSNVVLDNHKNEEETDSPGIEITKTLVQTICNDFKTTHFHFFTLNKLARTSNLIKQINI